MNSRDLNIELLTISTDNIWIICELELKDILIQHKYIGKEIGLLYRKGKEHLSKEHLIMNID